MKKIFVTGIGTDVGKTLVAAILTEALQADYWKPVQAGNLEFTDTDRVKELVSNAQSCFYPEAYRFHMPASPHLAAAAENIEINPDKFILPEATNHLVIEGAGGLLVPLTAEFLIIDLIAQLQAEVILVSQNYLGSINHTLLSILCLQQRQIPIKGIIFNGPPTPSSEDYITQYTRVPKLGALLPETEINLAMVQHYAAQWRPNL
ncbi:dethiobiotin synthase [Adhaeribacter radiodurans]|uniref:ATP-dependent dethiobiotin synthetase BioD n=1 Tax=Adhaeribacter radiodurans TaxID=2745197 RepID=A0A7L7L3V0_9BACT|nr:dethiobiotin synthase [Adhaeribacter radiodurans]QMU27492.1 dethiobiotin synthase [Adhaeribacter radiodurans]